MRRNNNQISKTTSEGVSSAANVRTHHQQKKLNLHCSSDQFKTISFYQNHKEHQEDSPQKQHQLRLLPIRQKNTPAGILDHRKSRRLFLRNKINPEEILQYNQPNTMLSRRIAENSLILSRKRYFNYMHAEQYEKDTRKCDNCFESNTGEELLFCEMCNSFIHRECYNISDSDYDVFSRITYVFSFIHFYILFSFDIPQVSEFEDQLQFTFIICESCRARQKNASKHIEIECFLCKRGIGAMRKYLFDERVVVYSSKRNSEQSMYEFKSTKQPVLLQNEKQPPVSSSSAYVFAHPICVNTCSCLFVYLNKLLLVWDDKDYKAKKALANTHSCTVCGQPKGIMVQCEHAVKSYDTCSQYFHPFCAAEKKMIYYQQGMRFIHSNEKIKYNQLAKKEDQKGNNKTTRKSSDADNDHMYNYEVEGGGENNEDDDDDDDSASSVMSTYYYILCSKHIQAIFNEKLEGGEFDEPRKIVDQLQEDRGFNDVHLFLNRIGKCGKQLSRITSGIGLNVSTNLPRFFSIFVFREKDTFIFWLGFLFGAYNYCNKIKINFCMISEMIEEFGEKKYLKKTPSALFDGLIVGKSHSRNRGNQQQQHEEAQNHSIVEEQEESKGKKKEKKSTNNNNASTNRKTSSKSDSNTETVPPPSSTFVVEKSSPSSITLLKVNKQSLKQKSSFKQSDSNEQKEQSLVQSKQLGVVEETKQAANNKQRKASTKQKGNEKVVVIPSSTSLDGMDAAAKQNEEPVKSEVPSTKKKAKSGKSNIQIECDEQANNEVDGIFHEEQAKATVADCEKQVKSNSESTRNTGNHKNNEDSAKHTKTASSSSNKSIRNNSKQTTITSILGTAKENTKKAQQKGDPSKEVKIEADSIVETQKQKKYTSKQAPLTVEEKGSIQSTKAKKIQQLKSEDTVDGQINQYPFQANTVDGQKDEVFLSDCEYGVTQPQFSKQAFPWENKMEEELDKMKEIGQKGSKEQHFEQLIQDGFRSDDSNDLLKDMFNANMLMMDEEDFNFKKNRDDGQFEQQQQSLDGLNNNDSANGDGAADLFQYEFDLSNFEFDDAMQNLEQSEDNRMQEQTYDDSEDEELRNFEARLEEISGKKKPKSEMQQYIATELQKQQSWDQYDQQEDYHKSYQQMKQKQSDQLHFASKYFQKPHYDNNDSNGYRDRHNREKLHRHHQHRHSYDRYHDANRYRDQKDSKQDEIYMESANEKRRSTMMMMMNGYQYDDKENYSHQKRETNLTKALKQQEQDELRMMSKKRRMMYEFEQRLSEKWRDPMMLQDVGSGKQWKKFKSGYGNTEPMSQSDDSFERPSQEMQQPMKSKKSRKGQQQQQQQLQQAQKQVDAGEDILLEGDSFQIETDSEDEKDKQEVNAIGFMLKDLSEAVNFREEKIDKDGKVVGCDGVEHRNNEDGQASDNDDDLMPCDLPDLFDGTIERVLEERKCIEDKLTELKKKCAVFYSDSKLRRFTILNDENYDEESSKELLRLRERYTYLNAQIAKRHELRLQQQKDALMSFGQTPVTLRFARNQSILHELKNRNDEFFADARLTRSRCSWNGNFEATTGEETKQELIPLEYEERMNENNRTDDQSLGAEVLLVGYVRQFRKLYGQQAQQEQQARAQPRISLHRFFQL